MAPHNTSPLRKRMIEDVWIRAMGNCQRCRYILGVKDFTAFLRRSPDTATLDDLRERSRRSAGRLATPTRQAIAIADRSGSSLVAPQSTKPPLEAKTRVDWALLSLIWPNIEYLRKTYAEAP